MKAVLTILAICLQINFLFAGNLHLVIIADSEDEFIGGGVEKSVEDLSSFFASISNSIDYTFKEIHFIGEKLNKKSILNYFNKLSTSKQDVLVVASLTHGFLGFNNYPTMDLGGEELNSMKLFKDISKTKEYKLFLNLVDCCNAKSKPLVSLKGTSSVKTNQQEVEVDWEQIKNLFCKAKGQIYYCSSEAYSFIDSEKGSFFINGFIDEVKKEVSYNNEYHPEWFSLILNVEKRTECNAKEEKLFQSPKYWVNIEYDSQFQLQLANEIMSKAFEQTMHMLEAPDKVDEMPYLLAKHGLEMIYDCLVYGNEDIRGKAKESLIKFLMLINGFIDEEFEQILDIQD